MLIEKNIKKAKFICRPNRFQAYVKINNKEIMVHVPNTGRCKEILIPGCTVILREENNPLRKTPYDLIGGYKKDKFINIDSHIPNKVVEEALKLKKIEKLRKYEIIEREKTFKNSRFDFRLKDKKGKQYYLEVKGVTFEENGKAMFPDAPTKRGLKHVKELIEIKKNGGDSGILFLIQMEDIKYFTPYDEMDKNFGEALRTANKLGVDIFAYDCVVRENYIQLKNRVNIVI